MRLSATQRHVLQRMHDGEILARFFAGPGWLEDGCRTTRVRAVTVYALLNRQMIRLAKRQEAQCIYALTEKGRKEIADG